MAFSSFPAATLSVSSSVIQWMFHQEVVISCFCCGPGRWTTAVVAVIYFYIHLSATPTAWPLHLVGFHVSAQPLACIDCFTGLWFNKDWIIFSTFVPIMRFKADLRPVLWTFKTSKRIFQHALWQRKPRTIKYTRCLGHQTNTFDMSAASMCHKGFWDCWRMWETMRMKDNAFKLYIFF